jgi:hypothetical protein
VNGGLAGAKHVAREIGLNCRSNFSKVGATVLPARSSWSGGCDALVLTPATQLQR